MRRVSTWGLFVMGLASASSASAQTFGAAPASVGRAYVEFVAQSAFGNVTSQAYGGEIGLQVSPTLQAFIEGGVARDVASSTQGAAANQIVAALAAVQPAPVTFTSKEPAGYGIGGLKYLVQIDGRAQPYVMAGGGFARVTQNVHFLVGGADVTSNINQFGIVLGSDLSGEQTKPMVSIGGGVVWPLLDHVILDFQYRYGRIFTPNAGINLNRAGIGFGVRF